MLPVALPNTSIPPNSPIPPRPGGEERLHRELDGLLVVAVPADEQERADRGHLPEQQREDRVVGEHDAEHRGRKEADRGVEAVQVVRAGRPFAPEVPAGVEEDHDAHAADQQGEEQAQPIGQEGEVDVQRRHPVERAGREVLGVERHSGVAVMRIFAAARAQVFAGADRNRQQQHERQRRPGDRDRHPPFDPLTRQPQRGQPECDGGEHSDHDHPNRAHRHP